MAFIKLVSCVILRIFNTLCLTSKNSFHAPRERKKKRKRKWHRKIWWFCHHVIIRKELTINKKGVIFSCWNAGEGKKVQSGRKNKIKPALEEMKKYYFMTQKIFVERFDTRTRTIQPFGDKKFSRISSRFDVKNTQKRFGRK